MSIFEVDENLSQISYEPSDLSQLQCQNDEQFSEDDLADDVELTQNDDFDMKESGMNQNNKICPELDCHLHM